MKNLGRVVVLAISLSLGLAACSSGSDTTVEYDRSVDDLALEAGPCLRLVRSANPDGDRPFGIKSAITVRDVDFGESASRDYRVSGSVKDKSSLGSKTFEWVCAVSVDTENQSLQAQLVSITERVDLRQPKRTPRT
jgi:hypothetical protein